MESVLQLNNLSQGVAFSIHSIKLYNMLSDTLNLLVASLLIVSSFLDYSFPHSLAIHIISTLSADESHSAHSVQINSMVSSNFVKGMLCKIGILDVYCISSFAHYQNLMIRILCSNHFLNTEYHSNCDISNSFARNLVQYFSANI